MSRKPPLSQLRGGRVPKVRIDLSILQAGKPCPKNEVHSSLVSVPFLQQQSVVFLTSRTKIRQEAEATAATKDFSLRFAHLLGPGTPVALFKD